MKLGYKASAEQFGPRELLDFSVLAEQLGLDSVAVSDHFQPWRHHGGHSPNALVWLGAVGERTERAQLGTSVLTPTLRYSITFRTMKSKAGRGPSVIREGARPRVAGET